MASFRFWSTSLLRGFRFGCCWLLAGFLVVGCAGRIPQQAPKAGVRSVSGYVLDAVTCAPLAGMGVYAWSADISDLYSQRTNSRGYFRLETKPGNPLQAGSMLEGGNLYYEGNAPIPADTAQLLTLLLKHSSFRFRPYGCQVPADSLHILQDRVGLRVPELPDSQVAFLIRDSSLHQPGWLRALTFRVGRGGFRHDVYRIHIYRYNGAEQPPGEEVLTHYLVWDAKPGGNVRLLVREYNVILPTTGFFVALECLSQGRLTINATADSAAVGRVLRPPCALSDTRTWLYEAGKGWNRTTVVQETWPLYESALSVEVEPAH